MKQLIFDTLKEIKDNIDDIRILCGRYNVKSLFAFGSVINNKLKPENDIDLLVDISGSDPLIYSENYFDLKFALEELFKRPVDLLEQRSLKNDYIIQNLEQTKVLLYGG